MNFPKVGRPKYLVDYIVLINIAIFIVATFVEIVTSSNLFLELGAKINYKIADYEYYRLITPMFLHADIFHIIFNSVALFSIGRNVEIALGKTKFLIIFLVSVLFGTMGSFVFNDSISVGASGGIFGLIGAMLFISLLYPDSMKKLLQKDIITLIVVNLLLGFTNPRIDNAAHMSGLIGGVLISFALGYPKQLKMNITNQISRVLLIALSVLFFMFGIPSYKTSENYYLTKGASLYYGNNLEEAYGVFTDGLKQFPNNTQFQEIVEAMK
ncbi:MAG: rhomboid family intramembrane serine protease [Acidaminobacteraceae bacterium]